MSWLSGDGSGRGQLLARASRSLARSLAAGRKWPGWQPHKSATELGFGGPRNGCTWLQRAGHSNERARARWPLGAALMFVRPSGRAGEFAGQRRRRLRLRPVLDFNRPLKVSRKLAPPSGQMGLVHLIGGPCLWASFVSPTKSGPPISSPRRTSTKCQYCSCHANGQANGGGPAIG